MKYIISMIALSTVVVAGCWNKKTPIVVVPTPTPIVEAPVVTGEELIIQITYTGGAEIVSVESPLPGDIVTSPLAISGTAPGYWFFEATAPVVLMDPNNVILAAGVISATQDRMTGALVPFEGTLSYTVDPNWPNDLGKLILKKDNPSGMPENDASLEMPIHLQ